MHLVSRSRSMSSKLEAVERRTASLMTGRSRKILPMSSVGRSSREVEVMMNARARDCKPERKTSLISKF